MAFIINTKQAEGKVKAVLSSVTGLDGSIGRKQRTVGVDHAKSQGQAQHAVAVGTLLDALLESRQKAMLRHPSGGQRVRVESLSDAGGSYRFTINV